METAQDMLTDILKGVEDILQSKDVQIANEPKVNDVVLIEEDVKEEPLLETFKVKKTSKLK
jgi:hypothetical protein